MSDYLLRDLEKAAWSLSLSSPFTTTARNGQTRWDSVGVRPAPCTLPPVPRRIALFTFHNTRPALPCSFSSRPCPTHRPAGKLNFFPLHLPGWETGCGKRGQPGEAAGNTRLEGPSLRVSPPLDFIVFRETTPPLLPPAPGTPAGLSAPVGGGRDTLPPRDGDFQMSPGSLRAPPPEAKFLN